MPAFVDTNVAVYALGRDSDKKARAKQILDDAPIASSWVVARGSNNEQRTTWVQQRLVDSAALHPPYDMPLNRRS